MVRRAESLQRTADAAAAASGHERRAARPAQQVEEGAMVTVRQGKGSAVLHARREGEHSLLPDDWRTRGRIPFADPRNWVRCLAKLRWKRPSR